jgi:hypothetical protein
MPRGRATTIAIDGEGHSHSIISWHRNLLSALIFVATRTRMSVGMSDKLINMRARPSGHFAGFEADRTGRLYSAAESSDRQVQLS